MGEVEVTVKLYDITLKLHKDMPTYPGDPVFVREVASGKSSEVAFIKMGSHTGTHVDAPAHMIKDAARLDDISPEVFIGPVRVFDLQNVERLIEQKDLEYLDWNGVTRALFKTKNSARLEKTKTYDGTFVAFSGEAAKFAAKKNLKLIGVDGLSIDRVKSGDHPAHMALLEAGTIILEGLNLSDAPAGDYTLFCGPLKIKGAEGSPARVFLVKD